MDTKQAAERVVAQLTRACGGYSEEAPVIRRTGRGYEIVWETGPYNWAMNDNYYLLEELKVAGMPGDGTRGPFFSVPKGFHAEPENGFTLSIEEVMDYLADVFGRDVLEQLSDDDVQDIRENGCEGIEDVLDELMGC